MAISMLKIRRPIGRLIFNMGIAIPGKTVFLIETAPWSHVSSAKLPIHTLIWVDKSERTYNNKSPPFSAIPLCRGQWNETVPLVLGYHVFGGDLVPDRCQRSVREHRRQFQVLTVHIYRWVKPWPPVRRYVTLLAIAGVQLSWYSLI